MSDWWARKLGTAPPAPAPRQYPPQPSQRLPQPPQAYQPVAQPVAPQEVVEDPQGEAHLGDLLRTRDYRTIPRQATNTLQSSACPGCGSGNYLATVPGTNAKGHCHDCGYPTVQSGSGLGSLAGAKGGAARPAAMPTYDPTYHKG